MKNNGHSNGHNGNGNGFMATIEAVKTNGNGNGSKAVEAEQPEQPVEAFDRNKTVKIVPKFDRLSTKGVEMFKDMGNLENAKLFLDGLAMDTQNETTIAGLLVLLQAIVDKAETTGKFLDSLDFIDELQNHLFGSWSWLSCRATEAYVEAVKSGNFFVEKLVNSDTDEVEENVDFRTRQRSEEFPSLIETDEAEKTA